MPLSSAARQTCNPSFVNKLKFNMKTTKADLSKAVAANRKTNGGKFKLFSLKGTY